MDKKMTSKILTKDSGESVSLEHFKEKTNTSSFNMYESLLQDFYGFEHSNTKWILSTLSSNIALKRLKLSGGKNNILLQSYFEIPDNPERYPILRNTNSNLNNPAFHSLVSLYLNPLGISIYTRNEPALKLLLDLKLNHLSDPCFVQHWWNKGDDTFFTDFSAIHLVALALRRNFFESIPLMMIAGYNPQERIYQIDHIQSSDKSRTRVFQDCLDQALNLMIERPCLNVAAFFKIITNESLQNRYDPIVFEMQTVYQDKEEKEVKNCRMRSLFRLVILQANINGNGKYSSAYLGILETIQKLGFFTYLKKELSGSNQQNRFLHLNHKLFCEQVLVESTESELQRLYKSDLAKLPSDKLEQCLHLDRNVCLGILCVWCSDVILKGRQNLEYRLKKIVIHILIESGLVVWFLKSPCNVIVNALSYRCCGVTSLTEEVVSNVRLSIIYFLRFREPLKNRVLKVGGSAICEIFDRYQTSYPMKPRQKVGVKKERTPYLVLNSRTMQTWNSSKRSSTLSKDFPMLSLQQKMGKMIHTTATKGSKKVSETMNLEASDDTITKANAILSRSNSLNSLDEDKTLDSVTPVMFNPPPLVIRKIKSDVCEPPETTKKTSFSTNVTCDRLAIGTKKKEDFIIVEDLLQRGSHFTDNILV